MSSSSSTPLFRVSKLVNEATIPTRHSSGAAGYDLCAAEAAIVPAHGWALVKTGIAVAIPPEFYGRIAPRSGLAVKSGIDVGAGVVDSDYRGDIGVCLFNHSNQDFRVAVGDRVAQLLFVRIETPNLVDVPFVDLDKTERDGQGFGSTGVSNNHHSLQ